MSTCLLPCVLQVNTTPEGPSQPQKAAAKAAAGALTPAAGQDNGVMDVLENTLWNRQLGVMSEEIVAALVCQIFEGAPCTCHPHHASLSRHLSQTEAASFQMTSGGSSILQGKCMTSLLCLNPCVPMLGMHPGSSYFLTDVRHHLHTGASDAC